MRADVYFYSYYIRIFVFLGYLIFVLKRKKMYCLFSSMYIDNNNKKIRHAIIIIFLPELKSFSVKMF